MRTLLALTLVAFAISGCGGSGASEGEENPSQPPVAADESPADDKSAVDEERSARLRAEIEEGFGGFGNPDQATSWYSLIERLTVVGDDLEVETAIYPDDEGREIAKFICNVLNGNYVLANTADYDLEGVTVYGQGRHPLAWTSGFSGHC